MMLIVKILRINIGQVTSALRSGIEAVRADWIPVINASAVFIRA